MSLLGLYIAATNIHKRADKGSIRKYEANARGSDFLAVYQELASERAIR
jgi:hypothetical protein